MAADNITLPREQVLEAAARLFAFVELFCALDEEIPNHVSTAELLSFELVEALIGHPLSGLDDERFERQPVLVELHARGREYAAEMISEIKKQFGEDNPLAYRGDPYTAKGLRDLAACLTSDAMLTRELGVSSPRKAVPNA